MPTEAPISITSPSVDPYSKQMRSRLYATFEVQALGITSIEGQDVSNAAPVRLPDTVEPGALLNLYVAYNGVVVAEESENMLITLFDTPTVVVTECLTVQLMRDS